MERAPLPFRPMHVAKTTMLMLTGIVLAACAQTPPRQVELHLPLPEKMLPSPSAVAKEKASRSAAAAHVTRGRTIRLEPQPTVASDLWERIRTGLRLSDNLPKELPLRMSWYSQRQYHMDRVVEQSRPYLYLVLQEVERRGMPSEIALLPMVESGYQPFALSRSGAAGIWQFIPSTGRHYGLIQNEWYDGRRNIQASTRAALDFLQDLYERLDNDWLLALAAYNSGGSTVERAVQTARRNGKSGDFWTIRPLLPKETRHYIPKLLVISAMIKDPDHYGITLKKIPNEPYLTRLQIDKRINLSIAAKLADLSLKELRRLNPGFNYLLTPPDGPHDLLLPVHKAARFKWNLAQLPHEKWIGWRYHTVTAGENLTAIAKHYGITVAALMRANGLNSSLLRIGEQLKIPLQEAEATDIASIANLPGRDGGITHTVTTGETLWSLARRYRVTITQLAKWNAIPAAKPLIPGQKLIIRPQGNT